MSSYAIIGSGAIGSQSQYRDSMNSGSVRPGRDALTTTRTSRVGLGELPDGAAIRSFFLGRADFPASSLIRNEILSAQFPYGRQFESHDNVVSGVLDGSDGSASRREIMGARTSRN